MENQRKEEKQIDQLYNFNMDYIDSELNQLLNNMDFEINTKLSSSVDEKMDENIDIQISKFEFH